MKPAPPNTERGDIREFVQNRTGRVLLGKVAEIRRGIWAGVDVIREAGDSKTGLWREWVLLSSLREPSDELLERVDLTRDDLERERLKREDAQNAATAGPFRGDQSAGDSGQHDSVDQLTVEAQKLGLYDS